MMTGVAGVSITRNMQPTNEGNKQSGVNNRNEEPIIPDRNKEEGKGDKRPEFSSGQNKLSSGGCRSLPFDRGPGWGQPKFHSQSKRKSKRKPLTKEEHTHFGDKLELNKDKCLGLFGFLNTNGLPKKKCGKKNFSLTKTIRHYEYDHLGTVENNRNWSCSPEIYQIPQHFRGHFHSKQLA
eukprot:6612705-Ditylum_brightwellii.AAC.1